MKLDTAVITYAELKAALLSRESANPVVVFTKEIETQEGYLDGGMLGRIDRLVQVHGEGTNDEYLEIRVLLGEFEAHNDRVGKRNYYDKNQAPVLSAKEAGFYPKDGTERFYCNRDGFDEAPVFLVVCNEAVACPPADLRANLVNELQRHPQLMALMAGAEADQERVKEELAQWKENASAGAADRHMSNRLQALALELFLSNDPRFDALAHLVRRHFHLERSSDPAEGRRARG